MRKGLSVAYSGLGWGIHTLTIVVLVLAILGPRTRQDIILGVALVVVTTIQTMLPGVRDDAGWLAAFHPVLALAVLGLAAHIGRRYIGGAAGGGSGAAVTA